MEHKVKFTGYELYLLGSFNYSIVSLIQKIWTKRCLPGSMLIPGLAFGSLAVSYGTWYLKLSESSKYPPTPPTEFQNKLRKMWSYN